MSSSLQQAPIGSPSNPNLSRTPNPVPEEALSPPPTLAALVASSEPDSPPLQTSVPEPHSVQQLLDMLRRTLAQIAADEAGPAYPFPGETDADVHMNTEADGEDHEAEEELGELAGGKSYHQPWNRLEPRPPTQYFRAFASSEEMRLLEELEEAEAELLARKVARQEEGLAWLRAEAERGVDGDDEEQAEEGDRVDETEAGSSDIQEVVVKVVAEVLDEDDEYGGKEQREATSSFFEPIATTTAAANRSVLPLRASVAEFRLANSSQHSIVRLNRPSPLNLRRETPQSVEDPLAHEGFCVVDGQTVAESWGIQPPEEDIFALLKQSISQGHESGSFNLINDSETLEYLRLNWTLATPYRTSVADASLDPGQGRCSDHDGSSFVDKRPSCLHRAGPPKEGIFPLIWQYVAGGHQSGSLHLTDERTCTKVYLRINWTLATPYRASFAGNFIGVLSPVDDTGSHSCDHLSLDWAGSGDADSQSSPGSCESGLAPTTQNPSSTLDNTSQVCQHEALENENLPRRGLRQWKLAQAALMHRRPFEVLPSMSPQHVPVDDEAYARQSLHQWNAAQAAFQQSHQYEEPSASPHKALTPRREGLAERGLQQANAARAAFERRRERDLSMTLPLDSFIGDDEALTQQGFQQWNAAQSALQQSYQYVGPSATGHETLTPRSEELAQRGRQQWWAAQTAYHCRMRAKRYSTVSKT